MLCCVWSLGHVQLFVTPWTVTCQAPLWDFPGKNTGMGCHFLLQLCSLTTIYIVPNSVGQLDQIACYSIYELWSKTLVETVLRCLEPCKM